MSSATKRTHERYFEILEDFFGDQYERMRQTSKSAKEVAIEVTRIYTQPMIKAELDQLRDELDRLWTGQVERLRSEIRGMGGVKAVYGGAMPPQGDLNFARRAALLVNATIIDDPASRFLSVSHTYNLSALIGRITHVSLRMLALRELAFACGEASPLIILPSFPYRPETERTYLREQMESYMAGFCSEVFGRKFESFQESKAFILSQRSLEELLRHLKNPELLSEPDRSLDPYAHLRDYMMYHFNGAPLGYYQGLEDPRLLTDAFLSITAGPLGGVSDVLFGCRSQVMRAEPVTDVEYCWRLLNWILKFDSARWAQIFSAEPEPYGVPKRHLHADALVLNVLMRPDFKWLGNVPIKDIARLREKEELKEIRDIFSDSIKEMGGAEPNELDYVVGQVRGNWNRAVDKHKREVRKLQRDAGLSAAAVVAGTFGAAVPVYSSIAMGLAVVGGKLAWNLHEHRKRPVGILLKAYDKEYRVEEQAIGPPGPY